MGANTLSCKSYLADCIGCLDVCGWVIRGEETQTVLVREKDTWPKFLLWEITLVYQVTAKHARNEDQGCSDGRGRRTRS